MRAVDDRSARLRLARLSEPGDTRLGTAVCASTAKGVLERIENGDPTLAGVDNYRVRLANDQDADLERLASGHCRFVVPGDMEWPTQLDALGSSTPLGLFVTGSDVRLSAVRSVAVVGARAATEYGVHVAMELGSDLADRGWTVVSGGAYGIDAAAHRGALGAGGATIAVLACGLDVSYPRGNAALFGRIVDDGGALVSELPFGATPTRPRFLKRNRVIAALARGTVVVEAAHRSGALNTASICRQLSRYLMAYPGPVTSTMSGGCHGLLRDDEPARLVTSADDVIEEVGDIGELAALPQLSSRIRDGLDPSTLRVLEAVPAGGTPTAAEVAIAAGLAHPATSGALLRLVAAGLLVSVGNDRFCLANDAAGTYGRPWPERGS